MLNLQHESKYDPPLSPLGKLRCTHIFMFNLKMLHFAPLAPQFWGEPEVQSPPELGDLGGLSISNVSRDDLCVHRSLGKRGSEEEFCSLPLLRGGLGHVFKLISLRLWR